MFVKKQNAIISPTSTDMGFYAIALAMWAAARKMLSQSHKHQYFNEIYLGRDLHATQYNPFRQTLSLLDCADYTRMFLPHR
jgi:hypothetical protein